MQLRGAVKFHIIIKSLKLFTAVAAVIILSGSFLQSCAGNDCYENRSALPLADFFSMESKKGVTLQAMGIYGVGAPGDSILYYNESLSEAYLPFRLDSDRTQYVFTYMEFALPDISLEEQWPTLPRDTVTFQYRRKPWFVSAGCGAMYFFEMEKVQHTGLFIDSVAYNKTITNENSANIKIYFKNIVTE